MQMLTQLDFDIRIRMHCQPSKHSKVRDSIVNLFLQLQRLVLFVGIGGRPSFLKVNLEWDETGQTMRLRRGIIEVEGVMPVLVTDANKMKCFRFQSLSFDKRPYIIYNLFFWIILYICKY